MTATFFSGIVSLKSRASRGNEQIPFLPVSHWAGHVWRMDGPRVPHQALYGEATPSREGRRKSIKAALKPHFKQWGQAAGSGETSSRQAGLTAAMRECRHGCFLGSGVTSGLRSWVSISHPISTAATVTQNQSLCVVVYGVERSETASLVFPAHLH